LFPGLNEVVFRGINQAEATSPEDHDGEAAIGEPTTNGLTAHRCSGATDDLDAGITRARGQSGAAEGCPSLLSTPHTT